MTAFSNRHRLPPETRDLVRRMYLDGVPLKEIWRVAGVSNYTVGRYVEDLPKRGYGWRPETAAKKARARQLYLDGVVIRDIVASVGVDQPTLHRWVSDLPRRTRRGNGTMFKEVEKSAIEDMVDDGRTPHAIADKLGRSNSGVRWHMMTNGMLSPRAAVPVDVVRKGRLLRGFRPDEDTFIEARRMDGLSCARIAALYPERFGFERQAHSIEVRLKILAARDDAAAA